MIKFVVLSLFEEMFDSFIKTSVIGRAVKSGYTDITVVDIRQFSKDKHKRVDFPPYGGGSGMILSPVPLMEAIEYAKDLFEDKDKIRIIYLSPRGTLLNYKLSKQMAESNLNFILICGHYEGIDERILKMYDVEEISIGDYVLTGGELASQVLIDSIVRLIPGVIDKESLKEESHTINLLEYPQYTKPDDFCGLVVPEILKSGNHKKIEEYRKSEALRITKQNRPDLYEKYEKEGK